MIRTWCKLLIDLSARRLCLPSPGACPRVGGESKAGSRTEAVIDQHGRRLVDAEFRATPMAGQAVAGCAANGQLQAVGREDWQIWRGMAHRARTRWSPALGSACPAAGPRPGGLPPRTAVQALTLGESRRRAFCDRGRRSSTPHGWLPESRCVRPCGSLSCASPGRLNTGGSGGRVAAPGVPTSGSSYRSGCG